MSESIYVYLPTGLTIGRDELEDSIDGFLDGDGKTTGGGSGVSGSNVDIELTDRADGEAIIDRLANLLRDIGVPPGARIVRPQKGTQQEIR